MEFDWNGLKSGIEMLKVAIGIAKDAKDLLPESDKKTTLSSALSAAERQTQLAEAKIAGALGYQLCRCTFPPQVMLSTGYKVRDYAQVETFCCPRCKAEWPPPPAPPLPDNFGHLG